MMNNPVPQILSDGYSFRFNEYISRGTSLFERNAWPFVGYSLLLFVGMMVANEASKLLPFFPIQFFLQSPLIVGFYIVANKIALGQKPPFEAFFQGFNKYGNILGIALIQLLVSLLCIAPALYFLIKNMYGVAAGNEVGYLAELYMNDPYEFARVAFDSNSLWAFAIGMIPSIYLSVGWILSYQYVWFYNMNTWEAMEASRKVVGMRWFSFFGFIIVLGLIFMVGVIALGIGILATMPIALCALYVAFADINKLENEMTEDESSLSDHLIS